jgi:hypothetical protein
MRARINQRFTQLHTERTTAEAKQAALTAEQPKAADPAILDEVPYAGDIIPNLPPDLKARLFAAFDLAILRNKDKARQPSPSPSPTPPSPRYPRSSTPPSPDTTTPPPQNPKPLGHWRVPL